MPLQIRTEPPASPAPVTCWFPSAGEKPNPKLEAAFLGSMNALSRLVKGGGARAYSPGAGSYVHMDDRAEMKLAVEKKLASRSGCRERLAGNFLEAWAQGSTGDDVLPASLQLAASQVFGTGLSAFAQAQWGFWKERPGETAYGYARDFRALQGAAERFLWASYEWTQEFLASHRIKEIECFRGMSFGGPYATEANVTALRAALAEEGSHGALPVTLHGNPLSSFSASAATAAGFAAYSMEKDADYVGLPGRGSLFSVVLSSKVPASRVVSLPMTGLGCFSEAEIVVAGGPGMEMMATLNEGDKVPAYGEWQRRAWDWATANG